MGCSFSAVNLKVCPLQSPNDLKTQAHIHAQIYIADTKGLVKLGVDLALMIIYVHIINIIVHIIYLHVHVYLL